VISRSDELSSRTAISRLLYFTFTFTQLREQHHRLHRLTDPITRGYIQQTECRQRLEIRRLQSADVVLRHFPGVTERNRERNKLAFLGRERTFSSLARVQRAGRRCCYRVSACLSVCLSVCHTNDPRIIKFEISNYGLHHTKQ